MKTPPNNTTWYHRKSGLPVTVIRTVAGAVQVGRFGDLQWWPLEVFYRYYENRDM